MTLRERIASLHRWRTGKRISGKALDAEVASYRYTADMAGMPVSSVVKSLETLRAEHADIGARTKRVRRTTQGGRTRAKQQGKGPGRDHGNRTGR